MASNVADEFPDDTFLINFEDFEDEKSNLNNDKTSALPETQKTSPLSLQNANNCNCRFDEKMLERLLNNFEHKMKVSKNANLLFAEIMRVYSIEIITRAGEQAIKEGMKNVTQEHLEKILPHFLLDFN